MITARLSDGHNPQTSATACGLRRNRSGYWDCRYKSGPLFSRRQCGKKAVRLRAGHVDDSLVLTVDHRPCATGDHVAVHVDGIGGVLNGHHVVQAEDGLDIRRIGFSSVADEYLILIQYGAAFRVTARDGLSEIEISFASVRVTRIGLDGRQSYPPYDASVRSRWEAAAQWCCRCRDASHRRQGDHPETHPSALRFPGTDSRPRVCCSWS